MPSHRRAPAMSTRSAACCSRSSPASRCIHLALRASRGRSPSRPRHRRGALGLDPESADAAALVGALIIEPPRELPPDLVDQLSATENALGRHQWKMAAITWLAFLLFSPVLLLQQVRDPWTIGAMFALAAA